MAVDEFTPQDFTFNEFPKTIASRRLGNIYKIPQPQGAYPAAGKLIIAISGARRR
jgi:hypothetical protein